MYGLPVRRGAATARGEPLPAEWKLAKEVYEKRESFDEKGFDHHPEHDENIEGLTEEVEPQS